MKRDSRIYWRERGGAPRAYADFRDLGGGREALIPQGEKRATTEPDVAALLVAARVQELKQKRHDRVYGIEDPGPGQSKVAGLEAFAAYHMLEKSKEAKHGGRGTPAWLAQVERHLTIAVEYFGADRDVASIDSDDLEAYVEHLRRLPNGRGGTLGETAVRKYLNSLSNMFRRARHKRYVPVNPVAAMFVKPTESEGEAAWLEPEDAALLLEAARTYRPPIAPVKQAHGGTLSRDANPHLFPILATFLLTGGRKSEVLGLEVDDVSLQLGKIYFRPNEHRRLKTKYSTRTVPLWPQLEAILRDYLLERERGGGMGSLLFPSVRTSDGEEVMIRDLRRALDAIAKRAGFPEGHVRLHMLRHTYTAARIQTTDRGAPVALYTVARELGHGSTDMIERRYGHLHDRAAHGSEVVSFTVDAHREKLAERLAALRASE